MTSQNPADTTIHIDLESALNRFMGDREILIDAIAIYREEAPLHLEKLGLLLAEGDMQGLSRAAHSLKGESGSVGAVGAQALCAKLEKTAQSGDLESSARLLKKVAEEVDTALALLPRQ